MWNTAGNSGMNAYEGSITSFSKQDQGGDLPQASVLQPNARQTRGKSKALLGIVLACAVVGILAGGATLAVILSNAESSELTTRGVSCPTAGSSVEIPGNTILQVERNTNLCTLEYRFGGVATPLGRTYNNLDWDLSATSVVGASSFSCNGNGKCSTTLPSAPGSYFLTTYPGVERSSEAVASRFLSQASFGATRNSIDELVTSQLNFKDWIEAQTKMPASLHRSYFRQRANPRWEDATQSGAVRSPCTWGSRWRRFAFDESMIGELIKVEQSNPFTLKVRGNVITEASATEWTHGTGSFKICSVVETVGGQVKVGDGCGKTVSNPLISFRSAPAGLIGPKANTVLKNAFPTVNGVKVLNSIPNGCFVANAGLPSFAQDSNNQYYQHDPRVFLVPNTISSPVDRRPVETSNFEGLTQDGQDSPLCPSAYQDVFNLDQCTVTRDSRCLPDEFSSGNTVPLNFNNLRAFFTKGGRYVYRFQAEVPDSPCAGNKKSRWRKIGSGQCASASNGAIDAGTETTLVSLLANDNDSNAFLRDITPASGQRCVSSASLKGISLNAGGQCWEHVHDQFWNVYDFTYWAIATHPGNRDALNGKRPNPIRKFAESSNSITITMPAFHSNDFFTKNTGKFDLVGRFGDRVQFNGLPSALSQNKALQAHFGFTPLGKSGQFFVACGSRGEVNNDPLKGQRFPFHLSERNTRDQKLDPNVDRTPSESKMATWVGLALGAADQLRQRVAWALSQIIVVSAAGEGINLMSEPYLKFYDIFVHHAFGNYRDVLREVSFSTMMGRYLSFQDSKSFMFTFETKGGAEEFPDENYAREIMQLFSIGLVQLERNGLPKLDSQGVPLPAYGNDNILTFARAWTGFRPPLRRGNIENARGRQNTNFIDSMRLDGARRDAHPKADLFDGYIGDGFPLCGDLPKQGFLLKGAEFRLLGTIPRTVQTFDPPAWRQAKDILRFHVSPGASGLHADLCNNGGSGQCDFRSRVVLPTTRSCKGLECDVETIRVVHVSKDAYPCPQGFEFESKEGTGKGDICHDGYSNDFTCPTGCTKTNGDCFAAGSSTSKCRKNIDPGAFYEYIAPACVQQSFPLNGKLIKSSTKTKAMCVSDWSLSAVEACCNNGASATFARAVFMYRGERTSFGSARDRCQASSVNADLCDWNSINLRRSTYLPTTWLWSTKSCSVLAKINKAGMVAIVHDVGDDLSALDRVAESNPYWFRVAWSSGGAFPQPRSCGGGCVSKDSYCLCETQVEETAVFSSIPSASAALDRLKIGAFDPDMIGGYTILAESNGVTAFSKSGSRNGFTTETVFRVVSDFGQKTVFLRNMESKVVVGQGGHSFRNAPSFMSLVEQETRDAAHETEAVLDHYVYHPNTAPFVAYRLIQRFTMSNPSPTYVEAVANAFASGTYQGIGSGTYGDLKATITAVLLHSEAREIALEEDPSTGQLREPLLKVVGFMRSLEFSPGSHSETRMTDLDLKIGQWPHMAPSVFSFFQPEFTPAGPVGAAALVAPEAQLLTTPFVVGFLNGMMSLVKHGLKSCDKGFGERCRSGNSGRGGTLGYLPSSKADTSSKVVRELDLLLTGGRLSEANAELLTAEYAAAKSSFDSSKALQILLQLFLVTPEFHATNSHRASGNPRISPEPSSRKFARGLSSSATPKNLTSGDSDVRPRRLAEGYKAIVYLFMEGAADSYNMLIPHSGCKDGLRSQYEQVRGIAALPKASLKTIAATDQPCSTFGMHGSLANAHSMYNAGELAWFANTGVLVEPITKDEYQKGKKRVPPSLFAHNVQQRATQTALPDSTNPTGVLGRIVDELVNNNVAAASYSISGATYALVGSPEVSAPADILDKQEGVIPFEDPLSPRVIPATEAIVKETSSSLLGETWAASLEQAIRRTEELAGINLQDISTTFKGTLGPQFTQISKVIKARDQLGSDRDVFFVSLGGFDQHNSLDDVFSGKMSAIDSVLGDFKAEMTDQGIWDDVLVVTASDFARTLTSNSLGTDHAWGGNYFVAGGSVKGGRINGDFPGDLTESGPTGIGRGRMIPTTPWEAIYGPMAEWFGVDSSKLNAMLPNKANFPSSALFTRADLFDN